MNIGTPPADRICIMAAITDLEDSLEPLTPITAARSGKGAAEACCPPDTQSMTDVKSPIPDAQKP
jgi:hypothetical protein